MGGISVLFQFSGTCNTWSSAILLKMTVAVMASSRRAPTGPSYRHDTEGQKFPNGRVVQKTNSLGREAGLAVSSGREQGQIHGPLLK